MLNSDRERFEKLRKKHGEKFERLREKMLEAHKRGTTGTEIKALIQKYLPDLSEDDMVFLAFAEW